MKKKRRIYAPTENWTRFPNSILDNLIDFTGIETRILNLMIRKNFGYSNPNKQFSVNYLAVKLGHSKPAIRKSINSLLASNSIVQIKTGARGIRHFDIIYEEQEIVNTTGKENLPVKKEVTGKKNYPVTGKKNYPVLGKKITPVKENKVKENNSTTLQTDAKVKQDGQSTGCTVARGKTKKIAPKKFNFADFCRQEAVGLQGRLFPPSLRWTDNQIGFLKYSLSNGYGGGEGGGTTVQYINNKAALATARSTKPGGWFRYFQRAVEENWSPEFTADGETRTGLDYSGRQVRYQGAVYVLSELGTLTLGSGVVTAGDVAAAIASGALEVL